MPKMQLIIHQQPCEFSGEAVDVPMVLQSRGIKPETVALAVNGHVMVPRPDGEIVLGATEEEGNYDVRPTLAGFYRLTEAALEVVPAAGGFSVEGFSAGLRPVAPDRFPIIGWAPSLERLFVATAHYRNGILLGPLTGRRVADHILLGAALEELAPFGMSRFAHLLLANS
jgi:glycine oxidase